MLYICISNEKMRDLSASQFVGEFVLNMLHHGFVVAQGANKKMLKFETPSAMNSTDPNILKAKKGTVWLRVTDEHIEYSANGEYGGSLIKPTKILPHADNCGDKVFFSDDNPIDVIAEKFKFLLDPQPGIA
jgi:hypothetical protein